MNFCWDFLGGAAVLLISPLDEPPLSGPLRANPEPDTKIKTGPPAKMTKTMVCQKR